MSARPAASARSADPPPAAEVCAPERGDDPSEPIAAALAELLRSTGADAAELFLTNRSTSRVWTAAHLGAAASSFRERTEFGRGEGFPGIVIERDEPVVVADIGTDPRWLRGRVPERGFRGYLCAPVHGGGRILGGLSIASRGADASSPHQLPALLRAADRLGEWLELSRLRARERLAGELVSEPELDPKRNLQRKVDHGLDAMVELTGADGGIVLLHSAAAGSLHPWSWRGSYERACDSLARSGDPCACPLVAESLDPRPAAHLASCPAACSVLPAELTGTICLPLSAGGRTLGTASVGWCSPDVLPGRHLAELEGLAEQLALAVADEQAAVLAEERAVEAQRQHLLNEVDLAAERSLQPVMMRIELAESLAEPAPQLHTELGSIGSLLRESEREIAESARRGSAASAPDHVSAAPALLDLRCFGRFAAFRGGQPIPPERFARSRALTLLKILLTNYGKSVHREVLVGLLWGEEPLKDPARQLKVVVHYLRRALGPDRGGDEPTLWVLSAGEGYAFDVAAPHRLDYQDFLSLVHWANRLRLRGEQEAALAAYESAARTYAGDFLEDEPYSDWCVAERQYLRETLLSALWEAAALRLERGDGEGALSCHRRALLVDPVREDVHRELMRVLWREGRHGDALRQYRLCCEALERELGTGPAEETRALHERLTTRRSA